MKKIRPSQRYAQALSPAIGGLENEFDPAADGKPRAVAENFVGQLLKLAMQKIVSEALEHELTEFLGRPYYQRHDKVSRPPGHRNGYETGRLTTAEGMVTFELQQARNTRTRFSSKLWRAIKGRTQALRDLAIRAYAGGLSTRDLEALLMTERGKPLLSKAAVSQLSEPAVGGWQDYERFCQRDLSHYDVIYLFVDAVYERLRQLSRGKEGILVAWAICRDG